MNALTYVPRSTFPLHQRRCQLGLSQEQPKMKPIMISACPDRESTDCAEIFRGLKPKHTLRSVFPRRSPCEVTEVQFGRFLTPTFGFSTSCCCGRGSGGTLVGKLAPLQPPGVETRISGVRRDPQCWHRCSMQPSLGSLQGEVGVKR